MKKIIFAAAALSLAALAYSPVSASAASMRDTASVGAMTMHHHHGCKVVKTKYRKHGHWGVKVHKVCR